MRRMRLLRFLPIVLAGCAPLPEAPETLDDLVVYFYENHDNEDPLVLAAGVDSFSTWVEEHGADLEEKYEIGALSEETVDALDDQDRTTRGLIGLAVITESVHAVDDAAFANTAVSIEDVYGDTYSEVERTVVGDTDCFLAVDCDRLEAEERYLATFAPGVTSRSHLWNQYVWGESETLRAYQQRNWILEKPEVSQQSLDVDESFYLNVFLPKDGGGHWRLQSTWMVATQSGVDPDVALNITGNSMRSSSGDLDDWITENL